MPSFATPILAADLGEGGKKGLLLWYTQLKPQPFGHFINRSSPNF